MVVEMALRAAAVASLRPGRCASGGDLPRRSHGRQDLPSVFPEQKLADYALLVRRAYAGLVVRLFCACVCVASRGFCVERFPFFVFAASCAYVRFV